jgi:glycosyltransferase involved in cell wall biosynthesis
MHVGIDASNLRAGGGVTHLVELLAAAEPGRHGIRRVTVWSGRATLAQLPVRPWLTAAHDARLDRGLPWRLLWQRTALAAAAARDVDVLFVPGGSYGGRFHPFVTMSRNLLPFMPGERTRYGASTMRVKLELLRAAQSRTFRRADGVIFLNAYARDAVTEVTGPLRGRTAIIPHGVGDALRRAPRPQASAGSYDADRPFRFVYVSTVDLYKHQWHVATAVAQLRAEGLPIVLELVGDAYAPALARLRATLAAVDPGGAFIRYTGPAPRAALAAKYYDADAFVFASSCENMPNILLEAMAAGLPIASADRGPMPSVLDGAGLTFDPEAPSSIAGTLRQLFLDAEVRTALAARAHDRAAGYSWTRSADDTFAFLAGARR